MSALIAMWVASPALAEEQPDEEVVVEAPAVAGTPTSQVTVIDVAAIESPSADVAAAVARAPGAVVQRLGGIGDLAQVGIRGAGARQVEVLLDGIPLNPEGGSAVNLAELPLASFDRIEVYRGTAPPLLGTGAMGGAVHLITGDDDALSASATVGSWRTGRANALASGSLGPVHLWLTVDGLTTAGTFRWYDDGNTRLVLDDDAVRRRANNGTDQLATVARARWGSERLRFTVLHGALLRSEGLPGTAYGIDTERAKFAVHRHLGAVRVDGTRPHLRWSAQANGAHRVEVLDDRGAELRVAAPQWTRSRTTSMGARSTVRVLAAPWARVDGGIGGQADHFDAVDLLEPSTPSVQSRLVGRAVVAAELEPWAGWVVLPAVRGLVVRTGDHAPHVHATPTLGLRAPLQEQVAIKLNGGWAARPPDPIELFGDRGSLEGNPALRSERSAFFDAGVQARSPAAQAELVVFARDVRDLIQWLPLPTGVARADNIDRATITGLEAAVGGMWGPFAASTSITVLRAVGGPGPRPRPQLPSVPVLGGRTELAWEPGLLRLATDLAGSSATHQDLGNRLSLGARLLWGASVRLSTRRRHWSVELDVRNVLDQLTVSVPLTADPTPRGPAAMVDVSGYPLPGRTWFLSLRARR